MMRPKASAAGGGGYRDPPLSARTTASAVDRTSRPQKTDVSGGNALLRIRVDRLDEGRLGIRLGEHLVVTGVDRPDAWAAGWRSGDVILKAHGEIVRDAQSLRRLIDTGPPIDFDVVRLAGAAPAVPPSGCQPEPVRGRRPSAMDATWSGWPSAPRRGPEGGPPSPRRTVAQGAPGGGAVTLAPSLRIRELADPPAPRGGQGRSTTSTAGAGPPRRSVRTVAPAGGEGDEWFAFVGAKVLVMSDAGRTLRCTVVEVEAGRVRVQDDSGELKDPWLPRHSSHIHPDIHHDHLDYDVDEQFDFVGAKVLVMSGKGHPLPCTVVEVDADRVKVRDNAHEFDDEWLPKNSTHINPKGGGVLQDGDDIDDWLCFVGAKILVRHDNGHTLPCTVIEVEEDKVKVHDDSGELKDKWLPKHSPHIHPNFEPTPAKVEYVVDDPFDFVGAKVLVMSGKGHPLPCTVVEVDADSVKVRDNAHEFEDEWLPKSSKHINPKGGGTPQAADDVDSWFAFVGAKILVMSEKGNPVPCVVVEVEADRVKVHDDSGELKDKWLPMTSTHIHPEGADIQQVNGLPEAAAKRKADGEAAAKAASERKADEEADGMAPRVLETPEDVQQLLAGKRVLHVKGFGSGLGDAGGAQDQQDEAAVEAIGRFRPDYLVVDGDPWGSGFQRYVKAYADAQVRGGLAVPELVWVKSIKETSPTPEEREKNGKKAREWAEQGLPVVVSWLPEAAIKDGVDRLFGAGCWEKLQGQKFDFRGAVRLLEAPEPDRPEWLRGLAGTAPGREMYLAIETVENRPDNQYFEKCSFENVAKGNAIYQHLRGAGRQPAAHGAVSFGGGESVLLEFATLYLFPGSGFDAGQAALFPFIRGRPSDPTLPKHEGHAFMN